MTTLNIPGILHPDLIKVAREAERLGARFRMTCTNRGRAAQNAAKKAGTSKAMFGQSPHNFEIALAFDFIPLDKDGKFLNAYWNNRKMFVDVANIIKQAAKNVKVAITWGGDFKSITDLPHIELANWKTIKGKLAP